MAYDLYETDFPLWAEEQAAALREAASQGSNRVDWENVAEEIADLSKREYEVVASLTIRIIEHLHKIRTGKSYDPRRHWRKEIKGFRSQVSRRLTTTLRNRLTASLEQLHEEAMHEAERWMMADEVFFDPIDPDFRWTLPEILGEQDDPLDLPTYQPKDG